MHARQTGYAPWALVHFIETAREINSSIDLWISDYLGYRYYEELKQSPRHLRSGKIPRDYSKEGCGVSVVAFYSDDLGNVTALCADGKIRQYIG